MAEKSSECWSSSGDPKEETGRLPLRNDCDDSDTMGEAARGTDSNSEFAGCSIGTDVSQRDCIAVVTASAVLEMASCGLAPYVATKLESGVPELGVSSWVSSACMQRVPRWVRLPDAVELEGMMSSIFARRFHPFLQNSFKAP